METKLLTTLPPYWTGWGKVDLQLWVHKPESLFFVLLFFVQTTVNILVSPFPHIYMTSFSLALLWHQKWGAVDCSSHFKHDKTKSGLSSKWLGFREKNLRSKLRNLLEFSKKEEHLTLTLRLFFPQEVVVVHTRLSYATWNSWTLLFQQSLWCAVYPGWQEKVP